MGAPKRERGQDGGSTEGELSKRPALGSSPGAQDDLSAYGVGPDMTRAPRYYPRLVCEDPPRNSPDSATMYGLATNSTLLGHPALDAPYETTRGDC